MNYHEDLEIYEFFYVIIHLVSMAAFYDDYKEKSLLSDERLKELALSSNATLAEGLGARHIDLAPQED